MSIISRYRYGYNWKPYTPYNVYPSQKRLQGICHALGLHYPARDGSWVFGASICGRCGMYFNEWPEEQRKAAADTINKLPPDQQQDAAASSSRRG